MYPYVLFLGITFYDILLAVGVLFAFGVFLLYAKKLQVPAQLQTLVLISGMGGVALGFGAAGLIQSVYFWIETGSFEWRGMTFYGGLLGGAAGFLGIYFLAGHFMFRNSKTPRLHLERALQTFHIVACSIVIAHAVGRLGCLTAGCCHGKVYEEKKWFTLPMLQISENNELLHTVYAVPVQLYEAVFLFALFAFLSWWTLNKKPFGLQLYMVVYGVWRFCIEFARADDRGNTFLPFLSPSQLTAILLIIGGGALLYLEYRLARRKRGEKAQEEELPEHEQGDA